MGFSISDFLPFQNARRSKSATMDLIGPKGSKTAAKLFKTAGQALDFTPSSYGPRAQFEVPEYDFNKIIQAVDNDSFVRQAFNKYKELLWKEGWDIVGENDDAVAYLWERLDLMEFIMRRSFNNFLLDVGDQLMKFGNVFIVKVRGDIRRFINSPIVTATPIAGYYILPAETVKIKRDRNNKILGYTQDNNKLVSIYSDGTDDPPQFKPDEVIHLAFDKRPGTVFGSPFMTAVMDDIIALRQMEQDVQNLVNKQLHPLFKYKVGTEAEPADEAEILHAYRELDGMRSEAGLVLPERHDVEVIGAEGSALDATKYLQHFMNRALAGLGISAHHLGIMGEGGNRSVTDRLDAALYDKVKTYQKELADMIRLEIFTELLIEGGFDPITHPLLEGISDRCMFRFREIDADSQIKRETHELQKWSLNAVTDRELRLALNMAPDRPEEETLAAMQARMSIAQTDAAAEAQARFQPPALAKGADGSTKQLQPAQKPDAATPASKGIRNPSNNQRGVGNKIRPSNQFGRRTSPNVRHSLDEDWLNQVTELLDDDE